MRVRSSSDGSLLLRLGRFRLWGEEEEEEGGGGTGCGTIPSPPPPLHPPCASALVASGRVGLCLSAGELQQNWRGLILVGVFF